ncbi:MAG TPA: MFS transporter [Candidatus Dormibacteraeota bacterium]
MLWRNADFLRLWGGKTASSVGDRVSALAVPTAAILLLHADALHVGLLYVCFYLPYPLLALPAGVVVDRIPRRPLLVACDLGRFVAVLSIPITAAVGHLALVQLYAVGLAQGALGTFFEVAYRAYLPGLVGPEGLVEGNSRLEASDAAAQTVGPGLGGLLIQLLTAPTAILVDAFSFVISAAGLMRIRRVEARHEAPADTGAGFVSELREGIAALARHPVIRWTAACVATNNCGLMMTRTVFLLFAYQVLHLAPLAVGAMLLLQGLAGLAGAAAAPAVEHRLGTGPTLAASIGGESLGWALLPLAMVAPALPIAVVSMLLAGFCGPIWNVTNVSLRQSLVPARLQGRIHASNLAIAFGTIPLGALAGGWLAGALEHAVGYGPGLALTLATGGVIGIAAVGWVLARPVRTLRLRPAVQATL